MLPVSSRDVSVGTGEVSVVSGDSDGDVTVMWVVM